MAAPSTLAALFLDPGKPDVPQFEPLKMADILRDTAGANLSALPRIEDLAAKVNAFNTEQDIATLEKLFPGAGSIIKNASTMIQSQMRGEIPEDVQRQLTNVNAEAARAGGFGGSLFAGAKTAKDFGLTSLQIMNQGLTSAERWLQQSRARVPLFNPAAMFATPAQGMGLAMWNTESQFNRDWAQEQIDKSLSMFEQAIMNSMQQMDQLILQGSSMAMGSAMGGGGGMMGGGGGGGAPTTNLGAYGSQWQGMTPLSQQGNWNVGY